MCCDELFTFTNQGEKTEKSLSSSDPRYRYRLGDARNESSPEGKDLGVLVEQEAAV